MGEVQILIDIDDKTYKAFTELISINLGRRTYKGIIETCLNAVKNGVVLPKGHGRLIDADALQKTYHDDVFIENYTFGEDGHRKIFVNTAISVIELAPTIIERSDD